MFFLGQAANLRGKTLRHTFAIGKKTDSEALKSHLAKRYGATNGRVYLYHNGRSALSQGLKTAILRDTNEHPGVIVTALTCYAVVEAVKSAGFTPVFADIDEDTLHFNGETMEKAMKKHKNIKAVIVQNNLGHPCDIRSIKACAKKNHLILIEDLAHSAGISYKDGKEAGTIGDIVTLSFGKGKSIDTISGGALVIRMDGLDLPEEPTKLPKFSDRFRDRFYPLFGAIIRGLYHIKLGKIFTSFLLKTHQIQRSADAVLDLNVRLPYWQAKLALIQLKELPKNRPPLREYFFVDDRDKVLSELEKAGFVMNDTWYDIPVSPVRYYKKVQFPEDECPVATKIAKHIVNLPTYYPRPKLQPARKIIEKYPLKGEEK